MRAAILTNSSWWFALPFAPATTTHFYQNNVVLVSAYTDTHHIQTLSYDIFLHNSWAYINLAIQFLCISL